MNLVELRPPLAVLLIFLTITAATLSWLTKVGRPQHILTAAARAVAQLALVSLVIVAVLRSLWLTAAFLALMALVASATSARRITGSLSRSGWWTAVPIVGGVLPTAAAIVGSGVVPWHPVAVLPITGILLGGGMNATSLAGRRIADELHSHWDEYEGLLALGIPRPAAVRFLGRPAASLALVPGLDQTRTVGLVTLPGAFVGVLLAGASPWQAGAAQVLVLVGLLLVQTVSVAITVELVARGLLPPGADRLRS